jgi:hypothetical protein
MLNRFGYAPAPPPTRCRLTLALGMIGALALLRGQTASAQVDVTQYHYDSSNTGQNLGETILSPANVNPTQFGKLFSAPVDGPVHTQPLYLSAVNTPSGPHNVVYVGTLHDSVYAFDADDGGLLWQRTFINPAARITPVPVADLGSTNIFPEVGIVGTPVIDYDPGTGAGVLYVVVKTRETRTEGPPVNGDVFHYVQKLHALDVGTGDNTVAPKLIGDSGYRVDNGSFVAHDPANPCVPGTGDGSINGQSCFEGRRENQRMGLALRNGVVWITWASHGDNGPYHGWVLGYSESDLSLAAKFNSAPNGGLAGIWESGSAPVFDSGDNMYLAIGNGTFRTDPDGTVNYGEAIIKLSTTPDANGVLPVLDFFTPFEQDTLNRSDIDQGSGGITALPSGYIVQTGKRGKIYVMDPTNLGGYRHGTGCDREPVLETCDGTLQFTPNGTVSGGSFDTPATFFDGTHSFLYYGGNGDAIKEFTLDPDTGLLTLPPSSQSAEHFGFTGVTPTISANGTDGGILWGLNVNGFGPPEGTFRPMVLFAYVAPGLGNPLYSSAMTSQRDQMGFGVKFNTPTVANGKVYVGTQGTCRDADRTANCGALEVFGLFPQPTFIPAAPSGLSASAGAPFPAPTSINLSWTNDAIDATSVVIERSLNGTDFGDPLNPFAQVGRNTTTFTDTTVRGSTKYYYRVKARNQLGDSPYSNIASATTHIAGSQLTVDDVFDRAARVKWTNTANDHYEVERSSDGSTFSVVGTVAANPSASFFTFTDTVGSFGTFFYRVRGFNAPSPDFPGGDNAYSNTVTATIGPTTVSHGSGFADHSDLMANGHTIFSGNVVQLTDRSSFEAASVFTTNVVGIRKFTTSFTIQQIGDADGMTFVVQGNSATAIGGSGGNLGYAGIIPNSVAIKFDLFNHGHGGYSTGQYVDGHDPDAPGPGEANINLAGSCLDLHGTTNVDLSYDVGTQKLIETLTQGTCVITIDDYPLVNIPAHVRGDAAFVGFTAATGGGTANQIVQSWTFTSDESGLPPRMPSNLQVTSIVPVDGSHVSISLAWRANNAYTATGFRLDRSSNGGPFAQIGGDLPVNQTSFTDANLAVPGNYAYRVRSFNATSQSPNSPSDAGLCVPVTAGGGLDHSGGFACNGDLDANGTARYAGISSPPLTVARLTSSGSFQAGSIFTGNKYDITTFHTTFVFRMHDPTDSDGMCFVIQGNDPFQLGPAGGPLGYGGIGNSLCVKFDIFDNAGEGPNSTGIFFDGRQPTVPAGSGIPDEVVDLRGTTIDLHSQHRFQVDLAYDGTTLTETIRDLDAGTAPFTKIYDGHGVPLNLVGHVGGNTAFLGFTAGTGGGVTTADVQTWTFRNP